VNHSDASGSDASGSNVGSSPTASHCLGKVEPAQSQQSMDMLYMLLATGISYGTNCFITAILPSDSVSTQCYHILPNSTEFKIWPTSDHDGLVKCCVSAVILST